MAAITDEQLSAYLDGELPPEQAQRIARLLREDARLAARLQRLKEIDRNLRAAVEQLIADQSPNETQDSRPPIASFGLPATPSSQAQARAKPKDFAFAWTPSGSQRPGKIPASANDNRWRLPLVASIAALAGIITGQLLWRASPADDGDFVLTAPLATDRQIAAMLDHQPSGVAVALGEQAHAVSAQVKLSFIAQDGAPCREFSVQSKQERIDAVACRTREGAWRTRLAARSPLSGQSLQAEAATSYRTATSIENEAFDAAVSAMMASDALDAAAESQMIKRNWQG